MKGLPATIDFVLRRVEDQQGRRPAPENVLVTSGCIEALELLGKVFLDAGDAVLVEAPTYLGAIMGFRSFGARVESVAMDEAGVRVDELEQAMARQPRTKLFYTVPDFQNPTGLTLIAERRRQVVDLARRYGTLVVEDVTYREFRFDGEAEPSLWSLGPDVVIQIGTFSKLFTPGVRLGWAVGPEDVVEQMVLAKQNTDQCAGALGQRLLVEYARQGYLERQIEGARALYRARRDLLLKALGRHMPAGIAWTRPLGGFVCWLDLPEQLDSEELAKTAMEHSVAVVPGGHFFPEPGQGAHKMRLSYSGIADDLIDEGIRRLAASVLSPQT